MGSLHVRTIAESDGADLAVVVDTDADRARRTAADYETAWSTDPAAAAEADAAIVATPAWSHRTVAIPLIDAGVPLLIEKPLAMDETDTSLIVATAAARGVPVMCGFVERFNPVIRAAIERIDGAPPVHITSVRHSPPNPRADISVVHDLLIHDLDLVTLLARSGDIDDPAANGWTPPSGGHAEVADCTLRLPTGGIATLSASRVAQRKVRDITIVTPAEQIELDLMRRTMTVYRHVHHDQSPFGSGYRADTVVDIPFVRQEGEPLALQLRHFASLVLGEVDPESERRSIVPGHLLAYRVEDAIRPKVRVRLAASTQ